MVKYDKQKTMQAITAFFKLAEDRSKSDAVDALEVVNYVDQIIPVHIDLEIHNYDEVDNLLAIYGYLYQKVAKLFAIYIHKVRQASLKKEKIVHKYRDIKDVLEHEMKAIKLQYESVSRRITIHLDRRK